MRTARFEADALIKGRFLNRKSTLIFSTDADISTDLGDRCVVVNVFSGKRLQIAITSSTTREVVMKALGTSDKAHAK